jgi:hypothetical protein
MCGIGPTGRQAAGRTRAKPELPQGGGDRVPAPGAGGDFICGHLQQERQATASLTKGRQPRERGDHRVDGGQQEMMPVMEMSSFVGEYRLELGTLQLVERTTAHHDRTRP